MKGDTGILTFGAFLRDNGLVATNVANEAFVGAVVGEGDSAVRAFADMAAAMTLQGSGEAAAVEEEDGLLALFEALLKGGAETVREDGDLAFLLLFLQTHIDDTYEGHGVCVGTFV